MRRLFAVLVLLAACSLAAATPAVASWTVNGSVVTCPAGDPLEGAYVTIWVNGSPVTTVQTNSSGVYSGQVDIPSCDTQSGWITVTLGSSLYTTYTNNHCPLGKGGAQPPCCVQRAAHVAGCSNTHTFDPLQLRCGVPGAPPCPSQ